MKLKLWYPMGDNEGFEEEPEFKYLSQKAREIHYRLDGVVLHGSGEETINGEQWWYFWYLIDGYRRFAWFQNRLARDDLYAALVISGIPAIS